MTEANRNDSDSVEREETETETETETENPTQPPPPQIEVIPPTVTPEPEYSQAQAVSDPFDVIIYVGNDNTQKSISVTEGDVIAVKFELSQAQSSSTDLTVDWGQTATAVNKFGITVPSTTVTIPENETSHTVEIPTDMDDTIVEGNATLTVTLDNTPTHYNVDGESSVTVTIKDNEVVQINAINTTTNLGARLLYEGETATITFSIDHAQPNDVVLNVNWDSLPGDEPGTYNRAADTYTIEFDSPPTVTITTGTTEASVDLKVVDDNVVNPNSTYRITLHPGDYVHDPALSRFDIGIRNNDAIVTLDVNMDNIKAGSDDILETNLRVNAGGNYGNWLDNRIMGFVEFKIVSDVDTTYIYKNDGSTYTPSAINNFPLIKFENNLQTYSHDSNWLCGNPPVDCGELKRLYISLFVYAPNFMLPNPQYQVGDGEEISFGDTYVYNNGTRSFYYTFKGQFKDIVYISRPVGVFLDDDGLPEDVGIPAPMTISTRPTTVTEGGNLHVTFSYPPRLRHDVLGQTVEHFENIYLDIDWGDQSTFVQKITEHFREGSKKSNVLYAGYHEKDYTVRTKHNSQVTGDKDYTITLNGKDAVSTSGLASDSTKAYTGDAITVTIRDKQAVTMSRISNSEIEEGDDIQIAFNISNNPSTTTSNIDLMVDWTPQDALSQFGITTPQTFTLNAGLVGMTESVSTTDDGVVEGNVTIRGKLRNVPGKYTAIDQMFDITIKDDDLVNVSVNPTNITEGESVTFKFYTDENQPVGHDVDINVEWWNFNNAASKFGFSMPAETVTIAGGTKETAITIDADPDGIVEGDGSIRARIRDTNYYNVGTKEQTVTIKDDDLVTIASNETDIFEGVTLMVTFSYTTARTDGNTVLTVDWQGNHGKFRTNPLPQTVTIGPNQMSSVVTIHTENDKIIEGNGNLKPIVTAINGSPYSLMPSLNINIKDNDHHVSFTVNRESMDQDETANITVAVSPQAHNSKPNIGVKYELSQPAEEYKIFRDGPHSINATKGYDFNYDSRVMGLTDIAPFTYGARQLYISLFFQGYDSKDGNTYVYGNREYTLQETLLGDIRKNVVIYHVQPDVTPTLTWSHTTSGDANDHTTVTDDGTVTFTFTLDPPQPHGHTLIKYFALPLSNFDPDALAKKLTAIHLSEQSESTATVKVSDVSPSGTGNWILVIGVTETDTEENDYELEAHSEEATGFKRYKQITVTR